MCATTSADEWAAGADPCAETGQCHTMLSSYESLIQGDGCRPFFTTGLCPRLCAFSLKSLVGRHTWARCVKRCDWPDHVIHAADSWLSMCLSRQEQEPAKQSDKQVREERTEQQHARTQTETKDADEKSQGHHWSWRVFHHHHLHKPTKVTTNSNLTTPWFKVVLPFLGVVVIVLVALFVASMRLHAPPVIVAKKVVASTKIYVRHYIAKVTDAGRRLLPGKKNRSRGVLEGPVDVKSSSSKSSSGSNPLL